MWPIVRSRDRFGGNVFPFADLAVSGIMNPIMALAALAAYLAEPLPLAAIADRIA